MKKTIALSFLLSFGLLNLNQANAQELITSTKLISTNKICTMEYMPVCGVDGITYGNKCAANNIKIKYSGECKDALALKKACTREYQPVCGVNEVTYPNKCSAGDIKVNYKTACKEKIKHPNQIKNYTNIIKIGNTLYGDKKIKTTQDFLIENNWKLIKLDNETLNIDSNINLTFNTKEKVSGSSGCNRYFGAVTTSTNTIKFNQFGSTLMACDNNIMKIEDLFLKKINNQNFKFDIAEQTLNLYQNNKLIMIFGVIK